MNSIFADKCKFMKKIFLGLIVLSFAFFVACSDATPEVQKNENTNQKEQTEKQKPTQNNKKTIVFFGNSLSAAYGIEETKGFVGLITQRIDSLSLPYQVVNAGLSGETTAGGKTRIGWILRQPVDVFILELGGNDALRGIDPDEAYSNLKYIIEKVREKYPTSKVILAGMEAPPNLGIDYTSRFREMYPKLAKEYNASLIPFLLDGVGGIPELNLPDGIHPTPEGHKILAENVWKVLKEVL